MLYWFSDLDTQCQEEYVGAEMRKEWEVGEKGAVRSFMTCIHCLYY
jgi:hypothetical protein